MNRRAFLGGLTIGTGVVACDAAIAVGRHTTAITRVPVTPDPRPRTDYEWDVLSGAPIDDDDLAYARAWLIENYDYEWCGDRWAGITKRGEKARWDDVIDDLMSDGYLDQLVITPEQQDGLSGYTATLAGPWSGCVSHHGISISHALAKATVRAICHARGKDGFGE